MAAFERVGILLRLAAGSGLLPSISGPSSSSGLAINVRIWGLFGVGGGGLMREAGVCSVCVFWFWDAGRSADGGAW